jgi:TonB family protein
LPRHVDVGSILAERYEIQAPLGQGGMGRVFRVLDRVLGPVAVKVLLPDIDLSADVLARFRDEVKLARKIRHRNVCAIYEYHEAGDVPFIVMELVEGSDLKSALHKVGSLEWEDAFDVAVQVSEGLSAIHEAGIVHRDLKPANLMRDSRNVIRVMDFGIAKGETHAGVTDDGKVVGTIDYMSPEQFKAVPLDQRSDIYSFGVVIYELFTGRVPFRGDVAAVVRKHLSEAPPLHGAPAARIPRRLVPVLEKALAKDRQERYSSAADMREAVQKAWEKTRREPTDPLSSSDWRRSRSFTAHMRGRYPREARLLVPALMRALSSPDRALRLGSADALYRTPDPAARAALEATREDPDPEVRERVGDALRELDAPPSGDIPSESHATSEVESVLPAAPAAHEELGDTSDVDIEAKAAASDAAKAPPGLEPQPIDSEPVPVAPPTPPPRPLPSPLPSPVPVPTRTWVALPLWLLVLPVAGIATALFVMPRGRQEPLPPVPTTPVTTVEASASAVTPTPTPAAVSSAPPSALPAPTTISTPAARPTPGARPSIATSAAPATTIPTTLPPPTPTPEPPATTLPSPPAPTEPPTPLPTPPPPLPGTLVEASDPDLVRPSCVACPAPPLPLIAENPVYLRSLPPSGGLVELRVLVDENGSVAEAAVVKGEKALADAALKTVRRWKYTSPRKRGVAVRTWLIVPIQFVLPAQR